MYMNLLFLWIMLYRYDVKVLNDMTPGKIVYHTIKVTRLILSTYFLR